jgi:CIC family chloride channel protein
VGAAAGLVGSLFFGALEGVQRLLLEDIAGYVPLRASGEELIAPKQHAIFRPWLLWAIPAIGAFLGGLLSWRFAPETAGGGTDAVIHAFHHEEGVVRRRVPLVKMIASILTLGSGGSGGREGPTMQIGGGLGSIVGRYLGVSPRERRILLVAGAAAGMAAVFRTPLGAALLAAEVLHRDDFESDALVPSVLASVVSYSVFISFFGEATLFRIETRYPFIPEHLALYAVMALVICAVAAGFTNALHGTQKLFAKLKVPLWLKPGLGGLGLGLMVVPLLLVLGPYVGPNGQGLGILTGGYGAAEVSIAGASWLGSGWHAVELLVALGVVKILATSLTVGSGGSAGDFGPSLVIGGIFGGAFGRAAQLVLHDPRISPGAFALVGMGTFYGGLAHVPIAALVMVCELAGSYDLLVPLMLCEGIAFVALRKTSLYPSQLGSARESPAHKDALVLDALRDVRVSDVLTKDRPFVSLGEKMSAREVIARVSESQWQDVFPVISSEGGEEKLVGIISADVLRTLAADPDVRDLTIAHDMMMAPRTVAETDSVRRALELMFEIGTREVLVTGENGRIVGLLDESEVAHAYHDRTQAKG